MNSKPALFTTLLLCAGCSGGTEVRVAGEAEASSPSTGEPAATTDAQAIPLDDGNGVIAAPQMQLAVGADLVPNRPAVLDVESLPELLVGGASLSDSRFHFHCDFSTGELLTVAFYQDRTARAFESQATYAGTWTINGDSVAIDIPDLGGVVNFANVEFVDPYTFSTNVGPSVQAGSCRAFLDGGEAPLN